MNNNDNDSDNNINFSDNYDDNDFFNDKSKSIESVKQKSIDVATKKVMSIKKSTNTIDESLNDAYDDDDWGDKSASVSAANITVEKP